MLLRGLKEDVSLFEVEGFSLMTLVTIMSLYYEVCVRLTLGE